MKAILSKYRFVGVLMMFFLPPPHAYAQIEVVFNISHFEGGYNVSCNGATDGTIEAVAVGANGPFFYAWSNGATTSSIQNLAAGVYTVTVTDFSNATETRTVELYQPVGMAVHLHAHEFEGGTNISSQGANDGVIESSVLGGTPPYAYSWSSGQVEPKIEGLVQGTYTLTVTDATNCTAIASVTLVEPSQLHITSITSQTHNGYNLTCFNSHNGAINLNVSGGIPPYRYQWNNGSFDKDQIHLEAGHYMVRVFDANEAEVDGQITITQPNELDLSFTKSQFQGNNNISCYGCSNGNIQANVIGGVTPYSYSWGTSQTTQTISNLSVGSFGVHVTDANGCIVSKETSLTQPEREDWTMGGNANTNPATQFIGTTDNKDLHIKTNNAERIKIAADGTIFLPGLAGGAGMLYVDSSGVISSSRKTISVPCSITNNLPIWNSITGPLSGTGSLYTCLPIAVGIGTSNLMQRFHVVGNSIFSLTSTVNNSAPLIKGHDSYSNSTDPDYTWNGDLSTGIFHPEYNNIGFSILGTEAVRIKKNTNGSTCMYVGFNSGVSTISFASTPYKMVVDGKLGASEIYCSNGTPWPDYVFKKSYKLLSISELKKYIEEEQHLPGIPTATDIEKEGMNMGELLIKAYEKIEGLSMYIIQLNSRVTAMENKMNKKKK